MATEKRMGPEEVEPEVAGRTTEGRASAGGVVEVIEDQGGGEEIAFEMVLEGDVKEEGDGVMTEKKRQAEARGTCAA